MSYIEKRKDLRPFLDAICGWVELNWQIGGIAWYKVEDLEDRLNKLVPIQGVLNKTYSASDNVSFDKARSEHVARLYRAYTILKTLTEMEDIEKLGHRSGKRPTGIDWAKTFDEARELIRKENGQ